VCGGIDKKMAICNINNREICTEYFSRIRKVLVSEAFNCLIIIPASMDDIIFFDYKNNKEINRLTELDPIISSNLSINDHGRFLISNTSKVNANINLYDLSNLALINKYYGHSQEQFCIECSFAGNNDEFILCGSEDASIYIWHRTNSIPISVVKGHTGTVNNCILTFYMDKPLIFSVSDDFTMRLWTTSNAQILYKDLTATNSKGRVYEVNEDFNTVNISVNSNNFMNQINSLTENERVQSSNLSESDEENESEMSN
jgi:WD40 repeat protein